MAGLALVANGTRDIGTTISASGSAGAGLDPATASLPQGARTEAIPAPEALDRALHAVAAGLTGGLSPAAISLAFADWLLHLAISPGKQMALTADALQTSSRLAQQLLQPATLFVEAGIPTARRPTLFCAGLGPAGVQSDGAGIPARRTMVADGNRRARCLPR